MFVLREDTDFDISDIFRLDQIAVVCQTTCGGMQGRPWHYATRAPTLQPAFAYGANARLDQHIRHLVLRELHHDAFLRIALVSPSGLASRCNSTQRWQLEPSPELDIPNRILGV